MEAIPKYEILANSKFYVEINLPNSLTEIDGYFMECQGFKRSFDVISICEVTPQRWGSKDAKVGRVLRTKLPGNNKSENIILKRGLCISDTMWRWFKAMEEGKWGAGKSGGEWQQDTVLLTIYNQHAEPKARFCCSGVWPVSYKISDLKAAGSDFELEEVELAVDEFYRIGLTGNETSSNAPKPTAIQGFAEADLLK
jgi:phage tail-like protein